MDRYQKIRDALAMGPTPGPWELKDGRTDTIENAQGYPVCTVHHHPYELYGHGARAAYIAACDPDTIRALLDERDSLAAKVKASRELMLAAAKEIAIMSDDIKESHTVDDAWGDSECDRHAKEGCDYLAALADKLLRVAQ